MTHARVLFALVMTFVALLLGVVILRGPLWLDAPILLLGEQLRSPLGTDLVMALTQLGGATFQILLGLALVAIVGTRCKRSASFLAVALIGSSLLNELAKVVVSRPRPTLVSMVYLPRGLSFPSGHSQSTMALALALALVLYRLRKHVHGLWFVWLALLPILVGTSRVYLGVHYPSDVLGGWLLAACWVVLIDTWYSRVDVRVTQFE